MQKQWKSGVFSRKIKNKKNYDVSYLTVRTLDTLAIGKIVFDVGFLLLVSELFMTPNSLCQITLSIYTMLTVTAFYKYIEQLIITITKLSLRDNCLKLAAIKNFVSPIKGFKGW